jgi:hypothetical protein
MVETLPATHDILLAAHRRTHPRLGEMLAAHGSLHCFITSVTFAAAGE